MSAISGFTMAGNELMELAPRTFKPGGTVIIKPERGVSLADIFFPAKSFPVLWSQGS